MVEVEVYVLYSDLKNKVVVITGGSTGIGKAIALRFAREHAKIVFNYLQDEDTAKKASEEIEDLGEDSLYIQGDVSKEEDVISLKKFAIQKFGGINVWINNAGTEDQVNSDEMSIDTWKSVLDVNLTGTFIGCREAIKYFKDKQVEGAIVNLSSVHEIIPWPTFAHYAAAKSGTRMLTKTLALEYAKQGIRVNAVAPGAIDTPINAAKFIDQEVLQQTTSMIPLHRIGRADEIAATVAWLSSKEAGYITGQSIVVDGGMTLYPSFENGQG